MGTTYFLHYSTNKFFNNHIQWFPGFYIKSLTVDVYLWWTWQTSLIFLSETRVTEKILSLYNRSEFWILGWILHYGCQSGILASAKKKKLCELGTFPHSSSLCFYMLHGKLLGINSTRTPINFLVTLCFKGKQGPLEFQNPPLLVVLLLHWPYSSASSGISHTDCSRWVMAALAAVSLRFANYCGVLHFMIKPKTTWYSEHKFLKFRKKRVQCWMDFILKHFF